MIMTNNIIKSKYSLDYELIDTVSNDITLKVKHKDNEYFLHSVIDPKIQGIEFARSNYTDKKDLFLFGIGLGYHMIALYKLLKENQNLYILECNEEIASFAMKFEEVVNVLKDDRIKYRISSNKNEVISFLNSIPQNIKRIYYYPCVKTIPYHLDFVREMLMDLRFEKNLSSDQLKMTENFKSNIDSYPDFLSSYNGEFKGYPCVISSSGLSLVDHHGDFNEYKNKSLFISLGRNNHYFKDIGFKPDIYIEVDSGDIPVQRFDRFESDVLLLFASTTKPELGTVYNGPKAQIVIGKHRNNYMMTGGGSTVASTAIELAIILGCNPIVLIGQDLCYIDGYSHFNQKEAFRASAPLIICNDGEYRKTSEAFLKHKRSIEKLISLKGGSVKIYSISSKGALINGIDYTDSESMLKILDNKIDKSPALCFINKFKSYNI